MTRQEITEFYREHHRRLYNTAWRILGDSDDAEEVMQDTILKYVSRKESAPLSAPQTEAWLVRTCVRAAIDRLRERRRRIGFLESYALDEAEVTEEDIGAEGLDVPTVQKALESLEEPYRLILNLVLLEGLDYGEISAFTGKKEVTVRSLFSRGRAKLKERLKR